MNKKNKGFTLIELVVVIGILAVLLAIVLIAINPSRQFKQANNTKRRSDVSALLNAVSQYAADNKGSLPALIPVGALADAEEISAIGANICDDISPTYISAVPVDPSLPGTTACADGIGYSVFADSNGRVTVLAPDTEHIAKTDTETADISVMR